MSHAMPTWVLIHARAAVAFAVVGFAFALPGGAKTNECKADLTDDGVVNFADLAVMKSVFFQRCTDPGPACGDGVAQGPAEQCDDGNLSNGDGCSATCAIELPGASYAFPATGQTTCWNTAGSVISCVGTGHDGDIQAGATLAYVDNGDGTITDVNTGLMWEKLSDDGSIHDKDNYYNWDDAFAVKVATLNSGGGFAGYTDWRVPNIKELQSIVNYEIPYPGPTVAAAFNTACAASCSVTTCSCTQSDFYWSSSSYAYNPFTAWFVYFTSGDDGVHGKTGYGHVRAVRGGS